MIQKLCFNFQELFHSDIADAHGWDNTTSNPVILTKLMQLVWYLLMPIRTEIYKVYKVGLSLDGCYRGEKVRAFLKAAKTGHPDGECADLICSALGAYELFHFIINLRNKGLIEYDQLILEYNANNMCVHIGYRHGQNRNQTLIRKIVGGKYVYTAI